VAHGAPPPAQPTSSSSALAGIAGYAASAAFRDNPGGVGVGQLNHPLVVAAGVAMSTRLAALQLSAPCDHCGESDIGLDVRDRPGRSGAALCGRCNNNLRAAAAPRPTPAAQRLALMWTAQNHMAFPPRGPGIANPYVTMSPTLMEMACVSLCVPVITCFQVSSTKGGAGRNGQYVTRGHGIVLSYPDDPGLAAALPRLPGELSYVVLRSRGRALGETGFLDFRVRREVILALYDYNRRTKPAYAHLPRRPPARSTASDLAVQ